MIRNIAAMVIGALLLTGCVYPYESAFETCDSEAGACYRWCEGEPDDSAARACRLACEDEANRCFDDAYRVTEYSSTPAYRGAWYGSFGYWRPRHGYFYDEYYYSRPGSRYDRYDDRRRRGYRGRGHSDGQGHGRRHRDGDGRRDRNRGGDRNNDPGATPPPTGVAPPPPPPTGVAPPPPPPRPTPAQPQRPDRPLTRDPQGEPRKEE